MKTRLLEATSKRMKIWILKFSDAERWICYGDRGHHRTDAKLMLTSDGPEIYWRPKAPVFTDQEVRLMAKCQPLVP